MEACAMANITTARRRRTRRSTRPGYLNRWEKNLKRLLTIALLASACLPCIGADRDPDRKDGPVLLAQGRDYTIHVFDGAVLGQILHSRIVRAGKVIFHTDTDTGKGTWMIQTGLFEIPTVRVSYSVSRLIGLLQTDTQIATVTYYAGRIYDRPPNVPPPDKGGYRVSVFEKNSGKKLFDVELGFPNGRPDQVPDETTELGVIQKNEDGFGVLGTSFAVLKEGTIKQKSSQQSPAGDSLKAAPEE